MYESFLDEQLINNIFWVNYQTLELSRSMTSLRYGRIFCLEFQKIDGTEYFMGSTELAIFWKLMNLEPWKLVGVYKIENK